MRSENFRSKLGFGRSASQELPPAGAEDKAKR
jgi:hypothetical protein